MRDSYFPFNHHLKDARERLAWLEFLNRHRKPLGKIKDLVLLATLWDYPDRDWTTKLYRLRLKYTGTAQSQHEALADLLRIRRALKVRTLVLKMYTPALGMPESHYHGEGKLGNRRLHVELEVPWFKEGCKAVRVDTERRWIRQSVPSRYSLVCEK